MDVKKKRIIAIISIVGIVAIVGVLFYTCYHKWNAATCEKPKTCSICGKTEGEPLGHKWDEATCEKPKICSICGKTEGEPLGHKWDEATCEKPKTCSICKKVEGDSLGHDLLEWKITQESSCSKEGEKAAICSRCNKTITENIDKIEHTPGDWEVKTDYVISPQAIITPGQEVQKCQVCGEELQLREYTIELSTSQRNAILKAYQEVNNWHCGRDFLINEVLVSYDGYPIEDATFAVDHMKVDWEEQAILYAKRNGSGESRNQLTETMIHYGFNQEQINKALAAVGY